MLSRARSNALTVVLGALLIVGGVSASRAAEAPPPAPPQPRVGGGGWGAAVADPAHGERVYQERCASCHDNPTGRTPTKAAISQSTPNFVMSTLREGVMKPMAEGLSRQDLMQVSLYLAKRQGGGVSQTSNDAPPCKDKPKPLTLDGPQWNGWGRLATNPRFQPEPGLKAAEVPKLKVKWAFHYAGGRNSQATVVGGRLFVNSNAGGVYSLNADTGCVYWRFDADAGTRTTITIGKLPASMAPARYAAYFADSARQAYAIDAETGQLLWKTRVDEQNAVQMTGSPTLFDGKLFVPISSAEEAFATNDDYVCCKFRGAVTAVDAYTGKVLWKRYTTEVEPKPFRKNPKGRDLWGPAGGAIWSAPTADAKRGVIYVATGDSYTDEPYDGSDAVIAMDMATGAVRWKHQLTEDDNFIIGCRRDPRPVNCPDEVGGDYDFGASPILHDLPDGKQVLLAGQKSSEVYALNPDDGTIIWKHRLSVGGALGGVEFGPATDRDNIYVALADIFMKEQARPGMTAIRIADGHILWNTPAPPKPKCRWTNEYCDPALSQAVSAIPGAVFAGAMDGHFRAYDTTNGKVIWDFDTAGQTYTALSGRTVEGGIMDAAGPTIVNGKVYVHTGYAGRDGNPGNVLLAFSVDGK